MPIPGQPPPSPVLEEAVQLLARGQSAEADVVATRAARLAKAQHGSGSHPLACAYADMARLHYRAGDAKRAAAEFKHASEGPMPPDPAGRRDRLAFMFGYAACLDSLDKPAEAEKVLRQCVAFARNLHGPSAPGYAASLEPLASHLLKANQHAEAARLMDEAYDIFWKQGDRGITAAVPVRAEALKAVGRTDDAFSDLTQLPDEIAAEAVARVIGRTAEGDAKLMRQVLADLLKFVDRRFRDGHSAIADTLAAIARHDPISIDPADAKLRATAARRAVWSFARGKAPAGLLESLEVAFEPDGAIHLVPHLAREPHDEEAVQLEMVLTQALDDLYSRVPKAE